LRVVGQDGIYTLEDGKATEGYAYFDPRPFLNAQAAPTEE
jgi:hypothetical protein